MRWWWWTFLTSLVAIPAVLVAIYSHGAAPLPGKVFILIDGAILTSAIVLLGIRDRSGS